MNTADTSKSLECFTSSVALGKRLLCSSSQAWRIARSEIRAAKLTAAGTYFTTEDLDRVRGRQFAAIRLKASALNPGEREQLRATFATVSALADGRDAPDADDVVVGARLADAELRKAILAEVSAKLDELSRGMTAAMEKLSELVTRSMQPKTEQ
jgi:hypothetical protein